MAEYLKNFKEGEDIKASEANSNNQFLLDKITDNNSAITQYLEGELGKINSTISSGNATLQNNINNLVGIVNGKLSASGGGNYCRFSNGLMIQWGAFNAGGNTRIGYFNPVFSSDNIGFTVTQGGASIRNAYTNANTIASLNRNGFTVISEYGEVRPLFWIAIGY